MKPLKIVFITITFLYIIFLSNLINIVNPWGILNSPDEVSNYLVMKEYASTGKMYQEGKYLEHDTNNLLHQRGFLTWNNKLVPFNYLGFPLFYGPIYNFFLENIKIVFMIVYVLLFLILIHKLYSLFYEKNHFTFLIVLFISLTPILFYLNFFYFNIIPNILFFLFYLYYLLKFNKTQNKKDLYLSVIFACISIFFRYDVIIFVLLIFLVNIISNLKDYKNIDKKIILLISLFIISLIFFVLPLLILNYQTYDNPLTFGYSLFNKIYFSEERTSSILNTLKSILFPSQVFDLTTFLNNLKVTFLISPLFFIISLLGLIKSKINKRIIPYIFVVIYFLIYNGMNPNTYLSGSEIVTLNFSVLRYWLLLFPLLLLPFTYYIKQGGLTDKIKILLITFLIIHSILFITVNDSTASIVIYKNHFDNIEKNREVLKEITSSSDYLITSTNGKLYYDIVNIISWWGGASQTESDKFFNATDVSNITRFLILNNHSVYYLSDRCNLKYIPLLEYQNLSFTQIQEFAGLYKISLTNK